MPRIPKYTLKELRDVLGAFIDAANEPEIGVLANGRFYPIRAVTLDPRKNRVTIDIRS